MGNRSELSSSTAEAEVGRALCTESSRVVICAQATRDFWVWGLAWIPKKKVASYNLLCLWLLVEPISLNVDSFHIEDFFPNLSHMHLGVSEELCGLWPSLEVLGNPCLCCLCLHILFTFPIFLICQIWAVPLRSYTALWWSGSDEKFHERAQENLQPKAMFPAGSPELFSATSREGSAFTWDLLLIVHHPRNYSYCSAHIVSVPARTKHNIS